MRRNQIVRTILSGMFAAAAIAAMVAVPGAQAGITVTFPTRLAAGPEFATDVLHDAWDMCNPEDISPYPADLANFSSFNFLTSPCRAGGATSTSDASLVLLYRAWYNALNPGKNGRNFPIDPSKYQVLSYKLSSTQAGESPQIYFFHDQYQESPVIGSYGRVNASTSTVNGTQIVATNLTSQPLQEGVAWNNGTIVRGLRFDPNSNTAGASMFLYWVRLTQPNGAMQLISWSGSGPWTITVRDNSDGTSMPVASGSSGISYNWNYGVLAPGSYTLTVSNSTGSGTATFSINHPPTIQVTDPSPTTGEDYATKVLGNPWDMSDFADIQLPSYDHHTTPTYSGGIATATSLNSDPNVNLLNGANDGVPIDTTKYRYLTVRWQLDGPFGLDNANGSIGRFFWGSQPPELLNPTSTLGFLVWPGMNSYTVDLATLTTAPDGGLSPPSSVVPSPQPWTSTVMRHLRFDPDEGTNQRTFHIDDVKLTAKPVAAGFFSVKFGGSDADGDPTTVSLYYDNDTNPNNGKTLIASGIPLSAGQYGWSTIGVAPGDYFIYAEANDGVQVSGRYSDAPVQVVPSSGPARPGDFDGDRRSDAVVFRPSNGVWYVLQSSTNYTMGTSYQWGASTDIPVPGDYDGDGRMDVAVFRPSTGGWFILKSSTNYTAWATYQWGANGDVPVPRDYDGDGKADLAVYRGSSGGWFVLKSSTNYTTWDTYQWGASGDIPVPNDYDGDGRADLAVFRPSSGGWFIRKSSTNYASWATYQWGAGGDIPISGDYDGDGKADIVIYRPSSGGWFILKSSANYAAWSTYGWGTSGDVPVTCDFDGDGKADITVYRPSSGGWFVLLSSTNYTSWGTYQWGLSGDVVALPR